ncbi:hypothetical protein FHG87_005773 [Trinorchestia longiramus]|nr:hypothetical protein FHG87_005773 [Trinorchestia longiramus]
MRASATKLHQIRRRLTELYGMTSYTQAAALFVATVFVLWKPALGSIDCFKCVSVNGDNRACEDPFHNNYSTKILESPCMAGRKNREGLFPATACIKLSGVYDSGPTVVIRDCALDSGTLTTDTEIIRMSHCGSFKLDGKYVRGCLRSCDDADGCNSAQLLSYTAGLLVVTAAALHLRLRWSSCQP